ncbi:MAG: PilZ domain-containing protein [Candidatus Omnitrophota bacterium]
MVEAYSLPLWRRSYKRFPLDASGVLLLEDSSRLPSIIRDLSVRGSGIVSDTPVKENSNVKVVFNSSLFTSPVEKTARVAWCRQLSRRLYQAGLDFGPGNAVSFD